MNDTIKERAISLAKAIAESEEYINFLDKEDALKKDEKAQSLLAEFQEKQQEFISKRLMGEVDEELLSSLTELQARLNELNSVKEFMDAYTKFVDLLGKVGDLISEQLEFDFGEVQRESADHLHRSTF